MDFAEAKRIIAAFEPPRGGLRGGRVDGHGLGEAFRFSDLESEVLDLDGVAFRTATARTLYRMKKDTARPQDQLDAGVLKERFGLEDE